MNKTTLIMKNTETEFKVGERYPMEGGGFGTVTEIHENHMMVRHEDEGGMGYGHGLDGRFLGVGCECPWDLLLPAIEPAGEMCSKCQGRGYMRFGPESGLNQPCGKCGGVGYSPPEAALPAIEPAKGFSGPTVEALKSYRAFWSDFLQDVQSEAWDPTCGVRWPYFAAAAYIPSDYPTREAALSEAAEVIRQIDALLEGMSHV